MKTGFNYVLFRVDGNDIYNRQTDYKGEKGLKLEVDPTWEPWLHVKTWGTVVQIPIDLTQKFMAKGSIHLGVPGYEDLRMYHDYASRPIFRSLNEIHQDIRIGDKIYFHYNTLVKYEQNLVDVKVKFDSKTKIATEIPVFKVMYDQIQCVVRGKQIMMIGGNVLVEPDMEDWDEILAPTYFPLELTGGKKKKRPKEQWIQTKVQPEARYLLGYVKNIGKPFIGDECELKVGDKIVYRPNADWRVKIEGKEYFCMHYSHIEMIMNE